ncbi:hypothetical protein VTK73DRAFT_6188 [Phialemonium thermophilum]|uniref:Dihydroneopterin aldolase/epimerase domain-containing protein n=1 Tax=Phialemonium thermophilum TaxID=223376 RepID=A0ABR3WL04_9PEZI
MTQLTTWAVQSLAGEPTAVVEVRNLQAVIRGGQDAWGRPDRPQPALVSARLSFRNPFPTADRLSQDTVHYGQLSRILLRRLASFAPEQQSSGTTTPTTLRAVLDALWVELTGLSVTGEAASASSPTSSSPPPPFLDVARLRSLSVTVTLPKASLLGSGVSLTATSAFGTEAADAVKGTAVALRLHGLRVPTLVGINANEREARQVVSADVEVDKFFHAGGDVYVALEQSVVQTMENSNFGTLEALGASIAESILGPFRASLRRDDPSSPDPLLWQVRVGLAKPTAVTFADCPVVELCVAADSPVRG